MYSDRSSLWVEKDLSWWVVCGVGSFVEDLGFRTRVLSGMVDKSCQGFSRSVLVSESASPSVGSPVAF